MSLAGSYNAGENMLLQSLVCTPFPSASCYVPRVPNEVLRLYSHSPAADLKRGVCPENLWQEEFRKLPAEWQIYWYANFISQCKKYLWPFLPTILNGKSMCLESDCRAMFGHINIFHITHISNVFTCSSWCVIHSTKGCEILLGKVKD